ncbi:trehalose-phosphatase [Stenotrophomonas sp. MMGLT7]|uniref:trehalose-phosphatase n=1 Tax=Stenotrophomonas sp. MMGLT7 TaxID=2901227 RepID=UPI001E345909|nr:trehalose-phosphatase [Stenotrophomonas sp. MMGLT7]MCD7097485.1 trehalose-phosphatase [Stenotrophomonas sp. MMGLT7]
MAEASPPPTSPPSLEPGNALFLDVDGTLIDFADRPERVHLLPQVRDSVSHLSERLHGALALVSGRPLAQLDALFAPLRLPAAGLHGHQLRGTAGTGQAPADASASLHRLHQAAKHLAATLPGVLVEDKEGIGLALHWRNAPQAAQQVLAFAEAQLAELPGYRLQPGDHVVEFVQLGRDKGVALELLMGEPAFHGRVPVFVGDDLTDEFGFAAANRLGGWSVLVGTRRPTAARYALPDIAAAHAWLRQNAGIPG